MAAAHDKVSAPRRARGTAMVERVLGEAAAALDATAALRVRDAVAAAVAAREELIEDEHDPRYLHPARTVRILLADTTLRDAAVIAAAAFAESVDAGLAAAPETAGADIAAVAARIPYPRADDDDLLERLVCVEPALATAALAERLDQARHLHLREDLAWIPFHASVRAAYVPAARRICPALARRFERWADAFERRLLLGR